MSSVKPSLPVLICVLLCACTSTGEVEWDDRDLNYNYDGRWSAIPQDTKSYQRTGSWHFNCEQFNIPVALAIKGSKVSVFVSYIEYPPLNESYISSNGSFKSVLPTGVKGKTSVFSDIDHSDIEIRLIVEGKLTADESGSGSVTIGWAVSKYRGCKTEVNFIRE